MSVIVMIFLLVCFSWSRRSFEAYQSVRSFQIVSLFCFSPTVAFCLIQNRLTSVTLRLTGPWDPLHCPAYPAAPAPPPTPQAPSPWALECLSGISTCPRAFALALTAPGISFLQYLHGCSFISLRACQAHLAPPGYSWPSLSSTSLSLPVGLCLSLRCFDFLQMIFTI